MSVYPLPQFPEGLPQLDQDPSDYLSMQEFKTHSKRYHDYILDHQEQSMKSIRKIKEEHAKVIIKKIKDLEKIIRMMQESGQLPDAISQATAQQLLKLQTLHKLQEKLSDLINEQYQNEVDMFIPKEWTVRVPIDIGMCMGVQELDLQKCSAQFQFQLERNGDIVFIISNLHLELSIYNLKIAGHSAKAKLIGAMMSPKRLWLDVASKQLRLHMRYKVKPTTKYWKIDKKKSVIRMAITQKQKGGVKVSDKLLGFITNTVVPSVLSALVRSLPCNLGELLRKQSGGKKSKDIFKIRGDICLKAQYGDDIWSVELDGNTPLAAEARNILNLTMKQAQIFSDTCRELKSHDVKYIKWPTMDYIFGYFLKYNSHFEIFKRGLYLWEHMLYKNGIHDTFSKSDKSTTGTSMVFMKQLVRLVVRIGVCRRGSLSVRLLELDIKCKVSPWIDLLVLLTEENTMKELEADDKLSGKMKAGKADLRKSKYQLKKIKNETAEESISRIKEWKLGLVTTLNDALSKFDLLNMCVMGIIKGGSAGRVMVGVSDVHLLACVPVFNIATVVAASAGTYAPYDIINTYDDDGVMNILCNVHHPLTHRQYLIEKQQYLHKNTYGLKHDNKSFNKVENMNRYRHARQAENALKDKSLKGSKSNEGDNGHADDNGEENNEIVYKSVSEYVNGGNLTGSGTTYIVLDKKGHKPHCIQSLVLTLSDIELAMATSRTASNTTNTNASPKSVIGSKSVNKKVKYKIGGTVVKIGNLGFDLPMRLLLTVAEYFAYEYLDTLIPVMPILLPPSTTAKSTTAVSQNSNDVTLRNEHFVDTAVVGLSSGIPAPNTISVKKVHPKIARLYAQYTSTDDKTNGPNIAACTALFNAQMINHVDFIKKKVLNDQGNGHNDEIDAMVVENISVAAMDVRKGRGWTVADRGVNQDRSEANRRKKPRNIVDATSAPNTTSASSSNKTAYAEDDDDDGSNLASNIIKKDKHKLAINFNIFVSFRKREKKLKGQEVWHSNDSAMSFHKHVNTERNLKVVGTDGFGSDSLTANLLHELYVHIHHGDYQMSSKDNVEDENDDDELNEPSMIDNDDDDDDDDEITVVNDVESNRGNDDAISGETDGNEVMSFSMDFDIASTLLGMTNPKFV